MVRLELETMNLETFQELLSKPGQVALADAMALEPREELFLSSYEKLRKKYPAPLAKAAIEMALLRAKARNKFESAAEMYVTREALEQSSGDLPAAHRARRFVHFGEVADLCCGIGGDALALARTGLTVQAVENDPIRAAMARANSAVLGLQERIHLHVGDAITIPLPGVNAAFADPSRRSGGRRHLDPEDYTPPLSRIRGRFPSQFPLAVKIAPGIAWNDIADLDAETEFVSVYGELKECVLWCGQLRSTSRRATVLPQGATVFADKQISMPAITGVLDYVFDPDPAIVRAGLAPQLAVELGISPIDYQVALFTGREAIHSPFLKPFRVEYASGFHSGKVRDYLRARDVGRVTAIKRGSSIDSDELLKKLKLEGENHRIILLTRIEGKEAMIVGERV
jgi:SAM-dependent methyltransferase